MNSIPEIKIRKIKTSEIDFLAEMLYEAIFIPEGHKALPKEVIQDKSLSKYIEKWGKDTYDIALVAEIDNQLVGAIWGRLFTEKNGGFGFIDDKTPELSMAVKSGYRNNGIGTHMIKAIALEYKGMGVKQLSLSVDKANNASRLYKRLGCEIVNKTEASWTMKKELN